MPAIDCTMRAWRRRHGSPAASIRSQCGSDFPPAAASTARSRMPWVCMRIHAVLEGLADPGPPMGLKTPVNFVEPEPRRSAASAPSTDDKRGAAGAPLSSRAGCSAQARSTPPAILLDIADDAGRQGLEILVGQRALDRLDRHLDGHGLLALAQPRAFEDVEDGDAGDQLAVGTLRRLDDRLGLDAAIDHEA